MFVLASTRDLQFKFTSRESEFTPRSKFESVDTLLKAESTHHQSLSCLVLKIEQKSYHQIPFCHWIGGRK